LVYNFLALGDNNQSNATAKTPILQTIIFKQFVCFFILYGKVIFLQQSIIQQPRDKLGIKCGKFWPSSASFGSPFADVQTSFRVPIWRVAKRVTPQRKLTGFHFHKDWLF
jgi:hypothetical protein